jgi:NADPH:quinone reductase-like Zn-dependent oxidoreductase
MKAVIYTEFGPPDVLQIKDIEKPVPKDNEVLVKVRAASVNPFDWHMIRGTPFLMRAMMAGLRKPKEPRVGIDCAGTVEAVGKDVTQFKPGDEVFGGKAGALAEYLCVPADGGVTLKPANVSFEQAAGVQIAGCTALQALRDTGKVQPGQKVLINGASGGVGTFAVQIAKSFGAQVTGVCSTRNVELVRSLGADYVIDYTKEDFTKSDECYDVIIDNVGTQPLSAFRAALAPKGIYIMIGAGGPTEGGLIGPMGRLIQASLMSPFISQKMGMMMAKVSQSDLKILADLMQAEKVTTVIDRTYPLSEVREAVRYLETGRARGKVIVTIAGGQTLAERVAAA